MLKETCWEIYDKHIEKNNIEQAKTIAIKDISNRFMDLSFYENISNQKRREIIEKNFCLQFNLANTLFFNRFKHPYKHSYPYNPISCEEKELLKMIYSDIVEIEKKADKVYKFLNLSHPFDQVIEIFKGLYKDKKINSYLSYYLLDQEDSTKSKDNKSKIYIYQDSIKDKLILNNINKEDPFIYYLSYNVENIGYFLIWINRKLEDLENDAFLDYMSLKYHVFIRKFVNSDFKENIILDFFKK